mgnify:CR=1 FL=1
MSNNQNTPPPNEGPPAAEPAKVTPSEQVKQRMRSDVSWKVRFNTMFTKLELFGVRAANKVHRGFVNMVLLFVLYNGYTFVSNYNNYWRLRRDPNIPK